MAIDPSAEINNKLDQIAVDISDAAMPDAPATSEEVRVAGLGTMIGGKAGRKVSKQLLEPLTKKGARQGEYKVIEDAAPPAEVPQPSPITTEAEPPVVTTPPDVKVEIAKPEAVTQQRVDEVLAERNKIMQEGVPREAPSPTPAQKAAGVRKGPANTTFYDESSLAAVVQAVGKDAPEIDSQSIQSIYDRALDSGIPLEYLKKIFAGVPLTTKVGGNEIAKTMARLQAIHDVSASQVDELMTKAAAGMLNDVEKFELREKIAQHSIIYNNLRGAKTDVARSMNTFKGARARGNDLTTSEIRAALDNLGGDEQLRALAEQYVTLNSRESRNKILDVSFKKKAWDTIVYTAQSSLLSSPDTHLYAFSANAAFLSMDMVARTIAVPIGPIRKRLAKAFGKEYSNDEYQIADISNRLSGFWNGLIDGIVMAKDHLLAKEGAAEKVGAFRNPVSSEYLGNTDIRLFGKQIRIGDFSNTAFGKILDGWGTIVSIPLRSLGAGDKIISGIAARMELHEQAARHSMEIFNRSLAEGMSEQDAIVAGQKAAATLLTERPQSIETQVQSFPKFITLIDRLDREQWGGKFSYTTQKFLNHWAVKPIIPFSQTIMSAADKGAQMIPLMNFVSPSFRAEWAKGGRYRDVAVARLAVGGSALLAGYYLASIGRVMGGGPSDTEDKNALKATGWSPFTYRFYEGELSNEHVKMIKTILGEKSVTQTKDGSVYVSLERLEPVNTPFLLGAAMSDMNKFRDYDPDGTQFGRAMLTGIGAMSEYGSNIPMLQSLGEFSKILNQRQTDGGERFVAILDAAAKQYVGFFARGIPGGNIVGSGLFGWVSRKLDPTGRSTAITREQADAWEQAIGLDINQPGIRAFFEIYNRFKANIPGVRDKMLHKLDAYGNVSGSANVSSWVVPTRVTQSVRNELAEYMESIHHGLSEPNFKVNGYVMTAEEQQRYIELYSKKIKIDGKNLTQTIVASSKDILDEYEKAGETPPIGVLQKDADNAVNKFRQMARQRMYGKLEPKDQQDVRTYDSYSENAVSGVEIGMPNDRIEFPRSRKKINYNLLKSFKYGR